MPPQLMDGTFTVPYITYDAYGRVTGRTNRTITLPAAPTSVSSATTATAMPNVAGGDSATYIPSGGMWKIFAISFGDSEIYVSTKSGGSRPGANTWIGIRIS